MGKRNLEVLYPTLQGSEDPIKRSQIDGLWRELLQSPEEGDFESLPCPFCRQTPAMRQRLAGAALQCRPCQKEGLVLVITDQGRARIAKGLKNPRLAAERKARRRARAFERAHARGLTLGQHAPKCKGEWKGGIDRPPPFFKEQDSFFPERAITWALFSGRTRFLREAIKAYRCLGSDLELRQLQSMEHTLETVLRRNARECVRAALS